MTGEGQSVCRASCDDLAEEAGGRDESLTVECKKSPRWRPKFPRLRGNALTPIVAIPAPRAIVAAKEPHERGEALDMISNEAVGERRGRVQV